MPRALFVLLIACGSSGTPVVDHDGLTDVHDFGATGDGTTDDTAALAAAAQGSNALFVPAGAYMIDQLVLAPNTLVVAAPGAILRARPGDATTAVLALAAGDRIDGLEIDGNAAARASGTSCITAYSGAANVTLHAVFLHDCTTNGASFGSAQNYVVEASRFERCSKACIDVGFSSDGRISDNTLETCGHGIQWWGGDSAVTDGVGISDVTITGNVVRDVAGGCIWGSDGERITITGNTAEGCGDVGIDLEGTHRSTVSGNSVSNATNAGLSTFFGSSEVTFVGNTVDQRASTGPGVKLFGTKATSTIVIEANLIEAGDGYGVAMDQGIVSGLSIEDNSIVVTGTSAAIRTLDVTDVMIVGNRLTVGGSTGISFEGPSNSLISDNVIHTTMDPATGPGDHAGIFLPWRSASYPTQRNVVRGNEVTGFWSAIDDDCWGDLASANDIVENRVDGAIYRRAGAGWTGNVADNHAATDPNVIVGVQSY